jgi:hypothetical protein
VSLHLQVSGKAFLLPVTAPVEETFAVLSPVSDAVDYKVALHAPATGNYVAGNAVLPAAEPQNGVVEVDLAKALAGRAGAAPVLENLIVGNAANKDYLLAGLSGNHAGCSYFVGTPSFAARAVEPVAEAEPRTTAAAGTQ